MAGGTLSLQQTHDNNQGVGTGFGSSGIPYSTNLATYPRDIYEVLFNPLIIKAHGNRPTGGRPSRTPSSSC